MFNKYTTNTTNGHSSVNMKCTVTEKRAPTDESVRLLSEMEQKALQKALVGIQVEGNCFRMTEVVLEPDSNMLDYRVILCYKLNEKENWLEFPLRRFDIAIIPSGKMNDKLIEILRIGYDMIAKDLASRLLEEALKSGKIGTRFK